MIAEIVSIGTELLMGQIVNTDAQYLSRRLQSLGISVYYHTTVGDNPQRMRETLALALSRSDVVITTGGLGPTQDDLSKEMAAELLHLPLRGKESAPQNTVGGFCAAAVFQPFLPEKHGLAAQKRVGAWLVRELQELPCAQRTDHHRVEIAGQDIVPAKLPRGLFADQKRGALRLPLAAQNLRGDFLNEPLVHGTIIPRSPFRKPQALASS